MKIVFVIIPMLAFNCPTKHSVEGKYYAYNRGGGYKIIINANQTYEQKMRDCTWGFCSKGKWTLDHDTILLHAGKLFDGHGKRVDLEDTNFTTKAFQKMNKLILKNDTLYIVQNRVTKIPLTKLK